MNTRPRPSWWYAQEPFDPDFSLVIDGRVTRYMESPLAEKYVHEPSDRFVACGIPPEEYEVRDHLLVAHLLRLKVTRLEFWWSQVFGETKNYRQSRLAFKDLSDLCSKSLEHRAAFLRIANGEVFPPPIRLECRKIVDRQDKILC